MPASPTRCFSTSPPQASTPPPAPPSSPTSTAPSPTARPPSSSSPTAPRRSSPSPTASPSSSTAELRQVAPAADLVTRPADAAVARLVGYENVIDVDIDDDGNVLAAGHPTGLTAPPGRRSAGLAIWATAIHVRDPRDGGLPATVARVTTGPGRHELTLDAGLALHAHVPLTQPTPDRGAEVSLDIDPTLTALLDSPTRSPLSRQGDTPHS